MLEKCQVGCKVVGVCLGRGALEADMKSMACEPEKFSDYDLGATADRFIKKGCVFPYKLRKIVEDFKKSI